MVLRVPGTKKRVLGTEKRFVGMVPGVVGTEKRFIRVAKRFVGMVPTIVGTVPIRQKMSQSVLFPYKIIQNERNWFLRVSSRERKRKGGPIAMIEPPFVSVETIVS